MLKWLTVTLWITGNACLQEGGIENGEAWSISNACHGCGIGKQYAEVCWLQPGRPALQSESIADLSYFVPSQHFGYSPSFHTFKQVVHKDVERNLEGKLEAQHTLRVFYYSWILEHNYSYAPSSERSLGRLDGAVWELCLGIFIICSVASRSHLSIAHQELEIIAVPYSPSCGLI